MERVQTKKVGGKLREIIARRIAQNRLSVPSMPAVAVRCLEQLRDKNAKFSELAATIEKDPLIASRILRIVNSPAYGGREPITSVENAISRLGMKPFRVILIELAAREVFASKNQRIRQAFRGIWEHCLAVGMLARDIAGKLPGAADADSAYLAGLFHDVGKPVVGALLLEAERSLIEELAEPFMTESLWLKVVDNAHRDVGAALVAQWTLPATGRKAIAGCDAYDEGGRASCTNLVRYANALTKRQGLYVGTIDAEEVEAVIVDGRDVLGIDESDRGRFAGRARGAGRVGHRGGRRPAAHDQRRRQGVSDVIARDAAAIRKPTTSGRRRHHEQRHRPEGDALPVRRVAEGAPAHAPALARPRSATSAARQPATIGGSPAATSNGSDR